MIYNSLFLLYITDVPLAVAKSEMNLVVQRGLQRTTAIGTPDALRTSNLLKMGTGSERRRAKIAWQPVAVRCLSPFSSAC